MKYYILKDKKVVHCSYKEWMAWVENKGDNRVDLTKVGDYTVSTVFLCVSFDNDTCFETMVFKGESYSDLDCYRCATWEEAEKQHQQAVEKWSKANV